MNEEEYLKDRLEHQITWYSEKSQNAQKWFKSLRFIEILAAAFIPLIAGFGEGHIPVSLTVGMLGMMVLLSAALTSLNQYQENWIEYRTTCESLKQEKFLFKTRSEPYDTEDPFPLLVQRVERILSKEMKDWSQYTRKKVEQTKPDIQKK